MHESKKALLKWSVREYHDPRLCSKFNLSRRARLHESLCKATTSRMERRDCRRHMTLCAADSGNKRVRVYTPADMNMGIQSMLTNQVCTLNMSV